MTDLPKPAHTNHEQKALGYINAGREGLNNALNQLESDHPAHHRLVEMIEDTYQIERLFDAPHSSLQAR